MKRCAPVLTLLLLAACKKDGPVVGAATVVVDAGMAAERSLASIVATCALAQGEVQVRRIGQSYWQPVSTGAVFREGDWIRTAGRSFARVSFASGGSLELEENAVIVVDLGAPVEAAAGQDAGGPAVLAVRETVVAVESGVVRGVMEERKPGEILAPLVIATADGSTVKLRAETGEKKVEFRLTKDTATGKTEVAVTTGKAKLTSKKGGEQAIKAGQAADLSAEGASEVVELIDFPPSVTPGIDARFRFAQGLTVNIAWKGVPEATGYKLQVARDLSFTNLDLSLDTADLQAAFTPKVQGMYAWRVAAKDKTGRYGEFGFARRIFAEKDQPQELLLTPENNATYTFTDAPPRIVFSWQSAANAQRYRLILASTEDLLKTAIVDEPTATQSFLVNDLEEGTYYWGAFLVDGNGQEPIFLSPRKLVVKRGKGRDVVKTPKAISDWGR